jgi:hypothetical protein
MADLLSQLAASASRSRLPEVLHGATNIELRCLNFYKCEWADLRLPPLDHLLLRLKLGRFSVSIINLETNYEKLRLSRKA